ncbi:cytochrome P450 [Herbaspirillum sp. RTI4]|uniref:cytochrome P450 n=1 Tax=Herbaspirillum sp. RTI4 TaxID=3048640 RepID=UPI002AB33E72|nr:cytochrome P450 [Herbaspirillum sp. RTI4]MDY7579144.1 cytochrome P450 [Herbaspirillum sp. RTI4]MEA9981277.1 cytochrome P450 [Herbaspirillum sp. RTI4]
MNPTQSASRTCPRTCHQRAITTSTGHPPQGSALTNSDPHYREHPHEILDEIRSAGPAFKDELFQRWIVTNHDTAQRLFKNTAACGKNWEMASEGTWGKTVSARKGKFGMVDADGEEHQRLRNTAANAFSATFTASLQPELERIADELIDRILGLPQFDFIDSIAAPYPNRVMAAVLGITKEDEEKFKRWCEEWALICDPGISPEQHHIAIVASGSLHAYFSEIASARSKEPKDDFISRLVHNGNKNSHSDDRLSSAEIAVICMQLIIAGNITLTDVMGNGLVALLHHPEQMDKLRYRHDLMDKAIEEILRFDPPASEIHRFCREDIQLEELTIRKGQTITSNIAGCNHDPATYVLPHQFDIERTGASHVSFGGGPHRCLGARLARMEIKVVFQKLLEAFPLLKLTQDALERKPAPTFNGYKKIMITTRWLLPE